MYIYIYIYIHTYNNICDMYTSLTEQTRLNRTGVCEINIVA